MTIEEAIRKLAVIEKEAAKGIRDNMTISMLRFVIFADGSGLVEADWAKCRAEGCWEEKFLHRIFTIDGPIFEFSKVEELEEWLKEKARNA